MIENNVRFISSVGRGMDVDVANDEPSHIHIARPSRLARRDNSGGSVEAADEVRELVAPEVTVQAA